VTPVPVEPHALWLLVTRLGEALILLPAAALLALWLVWPGRSVRLAVVWMLGLGAAVGVTIASKIAFIGYGLGYAPLDYTGISGHSMLAAAVYPLAAMVVLHALAGPAAPARRLTGLSLGIALAVLVGVSRIAIGAHSWVEVLMGLTLGALVSAGALLADRLPAMRSALWVPVIVTLWLVLTPAGAPASDTHGLITQWALQVSGRGAPYTRGDMHADWLQGQQRR
jgi:membrane-associated phospholipid phosphatase